MKELTIEEKAERYDKAIIKFKPIYYLAKKQGRNIDVEEFERIFPELKENEDERIRKDIIACLKYSGIKENMPINPHVTTVVKDAIAWLEKKGEKSVDKVKPKFEVGDWITNGLSYPMQISSIKDGIYYTHNDTIGGDIESMDKEYHLWSIQDAKDGDILTSHSDSLIWIYKNRNQYHACVNRNTIEKFSVNGFIVITNPNDIYPATDDERRILFKYIKKSGYVWYDAIKKLESAFVNDCGKNN